MKYIQLNGLNKDVSVIGAGCMRIARMTRDEVSELVHAALDHGINFFDHADIYGGGNSEKLFGEYLKRRPGLREKIMIQTKCAIHDGQFDFSKEHIIKSVEGSLKRLGVDYVDALLLHRPDTLMEPEEVAEALGVGYSWLRRTFKRATGTSPTQYKNRLLMSRAKELLVVEQQAVTEIAYTLGFENVGQFSTAFRKMEGVTPRQFRRKWVGEGGGSTN